MGQKEVDTYFEIGILKALKEQQLITEKQMLEATENIKKLAQKYD